MKKTEKIVGIIALLALVLKMMFIPGAGILTALSLLILSSIYFYFGFALFNDIQFRKIFKKDSYQNISSVRIVGAICAGAALSIMTLGILFKVQSYPGAAIMLLMGLIFLTVIVFICIVKNLKQKSTYYTNILKRVIMIGSVGLFLFILPHSSWVSIMYRDNPAYIEAYNRAAANPENQQLWKDLEKERQRMDSIRYAK